MRTMKVKVCGMRNGENIQQVEELGVDWIGMIFQSESPRNVTMIPTHAGIIPDRRANFSTHSEVSGSCKKVGVFFDEMAQNIITRVVNFQLDVIQLSGNETPTLIRNLRRTLDPDICPNISFWKAISVCTPADLATYSLYEDCIDMFVFGLKKMDDAKLLEAYKGEKPFLLSGEIGPDDVARINSFSHPRCIGIDLNTQFETEPGMKDVSLLKQFLSGIH